MPSVPEIDFYKFLGIDATASKKEINRTINRLLRDNHPDLFPNDATKAEVTSRANHAREWLESDSKRAEYDAHHGIRRPQNNESGPKQSSKPAERNPRTRPSPARSSGQRHSYRRKGDDIRASVKLKFEEAFLGCVKNVNGTNVNIPPRTRDGELLIAHGYGEESPDDGYSGDLYIEVAVKTNPVFDYYRDTNDLCILIPISELESIFGTTVNLLDFQGVSQSIKIPPRSNDNKTWKIDGTRFSDMKTSIPYSVFVSVRVTKLDLSQLNSLSEAAKHGLGLLNFELYRYGIRDKTLFPD
jgi:DnaJ-class molecular chaperone